MLRQKGKEDGGVTQMIDRRMLRQNKLSDRQGQEGGREEGRHMLLVICLIIKNLIYWHGSTHSLPYSLPRSTLTFPQAKFYLTREDDGKQRPLSSHSHVTLFPHPPISLYCCE